MRERFDKTGFEGWADHEILEFMLYNVYAQHDTNPIAHKLLKYSNHSIVRLLENANDYGMSENIEGVGVRTVQYLRSINEFMNYYRNMQLTENRTRLDRNSIYDIVKSLDMSDDHEDIYMICLDRLMRIKCIARMTSASDSGYAQVNLNKLLRTATQAKSANVVLVHNHPSGGTDISFEDLHMTVRIDEMLGSLGVFLVDHFIICGDEIVSIKMSIGELYGE